MCEEKKIFYSQIIVKLKLLINESVDRKQQHMIHWMVFLLKV